MKKLQLKKQVIADMDKVMMSQAAGGQGTIPRLTGVYPTLDKPCATLQPTKNNCLTTMCTYQPRCF